MVAQPPMIAQEVTAAIRGAVLMQEDPAAGVRNGSNQTEDRMRIEEVTLADGERAVRRFAIATLLILSAMLAPTSPLVTAVVIAATRFHRNAHAGAIVTAALFTYVGLVSASAVINNFSKLPL